MLTFNKIAAYQFGKVAEYQQLCVITTNQNNMLRYKDTTILSDLKDFFTSSEKAMETIVDFKGIEVKLSSKKGNWNGMMTTNTELTFEQAYKIYSTRTTSVCLKTLFFFIKILKIINFTLFLGKFKPVFKIGISYLQSKY